MTWKSSRERLCLGVSEVGSAGKQWLISAQSFKFSKTEVSHYSATYTIYNCLAQQGHAAAPEIVHKIGDFAAGMGSKTNNILADFLETAFHTIL